MAGKLSAKKRAKLAKDMRMLRESRYQRGEDVASWSSGGKSLRLDLDGYRILSRAVETLQSVPAWNDAYPFDILSNRIVHSLFDTDTIDEAVAALLTRLDADCKQFLAYAPIFGFNMIDGASIELGGYALATLGEERLESEIIGRLKQHVINLEEPLQFQEVSRTRKDLHKLQNVPILLVPFFGSSDGAEKMVSPIADRAASFIQFAIGMLTDKNTHIIDHRGRFTGEFKATMPVMTVEYDELSFPNVRGWPHRISIGPKDVERLDELGILSVAREYMGRSWGSRKSMISLLARAISCFSDGERGITEMSRIVSYTSVIEIFFCRKDCVDESFAVGLASATWNNQEPFDAVYQLAKEIYEQRSRAVHDGIEPTFMWIARRKAKQVIQRMMALRDRLKTRKEIHAWVEAERTRACAGPTPDAAGANVETKVDRSDSREPENEYGS